MLIQITTHGLELEDTLIPSGSAHLRTDIAPGQSCTWGWPRAFSGWVYGGAFLSKHFCELRMAVCALRILSAPY